METIIITTEADIEKIIERVIERKFPKPIGRITDAWIVRWQKDLAGLVILNCSESFWRLITIRWKGHL